MNRTDRPRRRFLLGLGAGVTAGLAGCLGDDSEDDATGDPDDDGVDVERAGSSIEEAKDHLADAATMLADEEAQSGDPEEIGNTLDDAKAALDEALEYADHDQSAEISFLLDVTRWLRQTTVALASFHVWNRQFKIATSYREEGSYDEALDTLEDATESIAGADRARSQAVEDYEDLDEDRLGDLEEVNHEAVAAWLENDLRDGVTSGTILTDGFSEMVPAFRDLRAAIEAWDAEDWTTARDLFADARDQFTLAEATLEDAEEESPPDLQEDVVELTDLAGSFAEASDHYQAAMAAKQDGDEERYNEEIAAAEAALE